MHAQSLSCVWLTLHDPITVARQAPLSKEYWTRILEGVAISSSRDLPHQGMETTTPTAPALAGWFFTTKPQGRWEYNFIWK